MKKLKHSVPAALCLLLCIHLNLSAQNVNIPDPAFKAALLIIPALNTNGDGEIQLSEAVGYTGPIYVHSLAISDLTGINSFMSITDLDCAGNSISSLDVFYCASLCTLNCAGNQINTLVLPNTANLTRLECQNNQLTSLNLSGATSLHTLSCHHNFITSLTPPISLVYIDCGYNQLTSLSAGGNMSLVTLYCNNNQLSSLFIGNPPLVTLNCTSNQLSSLDVSDINGANAQILCSQNQLTSLLAGTANIQAMNCSYNLLTALDFSGTAITNLNCQNNHLNYFDIKNGLNQSFTFFNATNNPDLDCIQVDNAAWSTTNWTQIDPTTVFSEDCAYGLNDMRVHNPVIHVYPNPCTGDFNIEAGNDDKLAEVYSPQGKKLFTVALNSSTTTLSLRGYGRGMYYVVLRDEKGNMSAVKVLVE